MTSIEEIDPTSEQDHQGFHSNLSTEERNLLITLAREALEQAAYGKKLPRLDLGTLPPRLQQPGATFVTLTRKGELRGCIGSLKPRLPLAEDVREHTVAAAKQDYRFLPVTPEELPEIKIEISRLGDTQEIQYNSPEELVDKLRPGVDGVTLIRGGQRATFLPQVWKKLPNPADFLGHLCQKMGAPKDYWRKELFTVEIYQVEEFRE